MARHVLTDEQKLRGLRKGIRILKKKRGGPKWLIPSMEKYLERLKKAQSSRQGNLRPVA
jgi:hypothetical protein